MENNANKTFTFSYTYDNLDRLKTATLNEATLFDINYYPNGNIHDKTDVGTYQYNTPKPHAMSGIANVQSGVNQDVKQFIDYTPFHKISRIRQGADEFNITDQYNIYYGLDQQRIKTEQLHEGNIVRTRYYLGSYELDVDASGVETKTDYIAAPSGLVAMQKNGTLYYVHTDRQGSIERITDIRGSIQTAYAYTAWGGRIKLSGTDITDRGYTGHEHLTAFQTADGFTLINMNGRVYDPVLARFLSPDPYVQAPDFTQSFNRYSYCLNNPFKYTDPTGEFAFIPVLVGMAYGALIGAASSAVIYTAQAAISGNWDNYGIGLLKAMGMGAVGGAIGGGLGAIGSQLGTFGQSLAYNMMSNVASNSATTLAFGGDISLGSVVGSIAGGFVGYKIGNFTGVKGNAFENAVSEVAFNAMKGAATGAIGGGIGAALDGKNVMDGMINGMKNGAIAGAMVSVLNIAAMGAAYLPNGTKERFANDDKAFGIRAGDAVYRRGGLVTFIGKHPITLGRNMLVPTKYNNPNSKHYDPIYFYQTLAHERAHIYQQEVMGFGSFYNRTLYEYFINPGYSNNPYINPNCLEYWADQYMTSTP